MIDTEQEIIDAKLEGNFEKLDYLTKRRQRLLNNLLVNYRYKSRILFMDTCINTNESLYVEKDYVIASASPFAFLLDPFMYDFDAKYDEETDTYTYLYKFNGTRADDKGLTLEITVYELLEQD